MRIRTELLVTEHRQPLLERELEPVAASDAVARPIMEILVGDDTVDILKIGIRRQIGARQHVLGIKDVEAFVFHRPHVEVADGNDHVMVEIALQAKALLIPAHRLFQRRHRVSALVKFSRFDVNRQLYRAPRSCRERIAQHIKLAGNHGKKIAGLTERVLPDRVVAAVRLIARRNWVAVGKQHGETRLIGMQRHRITRHHVRPVGEPGNAAETLRLALGEIAVAAAVKTGQRRICIRLDTHARFQ